MYLSKLSNVFVQIDNYICAIVRSVGEPDVSMLPPWPLATASYLSKLQILFVQIANVFV